MICTLAESINSETGISIGVLLAVIGILISVSGGLWYIAKLLIKMNDKIDGLAHRLDAIDRDVVKIDQATKIAASHARANPGIRVPDPRDPDRFFVSNVEGEQMEVAT